MMLSDDHLRHLVPMPPSPCGCAPRPWPRPVVPVPVTPQMQPHWAEELHRILGGKQDAIPDLDDIREGAQAGATAYQKPEDGIPKTDLTASVQASLDNADTAVQPDDILSGGKVKSDLLPSYVDDVIEVANYASLPDPGEEGKIYVTLDTNKTYRWGGTAFVEISSQDMTGKADKVANAASGNLAGLDLGGNLTDSGKKPADFAAASHTHTASQITGLGTAAKKDVPASGNASTTQVVLGSDTRLGNARTPTAHASSHATDGSDPITPPSIGAATKADVTLTERGPNHDGFSAWDILHTPLTAEQKADFYNESADAAVNDYAVTIRDGSLYVGGYGAASLLLSPDGSRYAFSVGSPTASIIWGPNGTTVATRTALQGYQLGSQTNKPLASEAEAEALRTAVAGKMPSTATGADIAVSGTDATKISAALTMLQDDIGITVYHSGKVYTDANLVITRGALYKCVIIESSLTWVDAEWEKLFDLVPLAPLASPAFTGTPTAPTPTAGDNSTKVATTAFVQKAAPYALGTPTVIDTASSETVEGETVYYGAATLANRTANIVQVTAATALDELRITFPAATSGKVRDFGLRVEIGTGSVALAAPALVPIAPTGETIKLENADGTIPALAGGTATAKGVTLLYFSETASGVFVVKGEQVEEVA